MNIKRIFTYGCSFGRWRWPDMIQKNFGDEYKYIKKPTAPKQQDVSWWQRLQQRAFGDADVNENFADGKV